MIKTAFPSTSGNRVDIRDPEVALIGPTTGAMLAIAPGTTEITATVDGKSGERTISVARPITRRRA